MVPYARHMPTFKLGRWDGKVSFATIGGSTYLNLIDRILPIILDAGYEIDIDDQRPDYKFEFPVIDDRFVSDRCWPAGHPMAGEPIMLREHQVEAINNYFSNTQSIQSLATGAGKTLITAVLSMQCEPYGRSLVIVPSKTLVEQTEDDYKNLGLDVGVYFGDRKEYGRKHTIATWQSIASFCKKKDDFKNLDDSFNALTDGVMTVIVDEAHTAKGAVLKDLLTNSLAHVPIRWAMTGTVPKEDFQFLSLLSAIGPVVGEVRAKTLQDRDILSKLQIEILQTDDSHVAYGDYAAEYDFLVNDTARLAWLAKFCNGLEGNTLILVDRIATGNSLTEMLNDSVFISGEMKNKDRRAEFKELAEVHGRRMVATYGTMSTGVNIPKIHNLVLFHCGKSPFRTIQSVGRVLRKAPGKDVAMVYDVCSNLKFDARHLTARKKLYRENEYPFTLTKVKYV